MAILSGETELALCIIRVKVHDLEFFYSILDTSTKN